MSTTTPLPLAGKSELVTRAARNIGAFTSEVQFQSCLTHSSRLGLKNSPERCAVDIAVDGVCSVELGVVKSVKSFEAEFERGRLLDARSLAQRHIVVVDSGSIENSAVCRAEGAERVRGEQCGVEGTRIVPWIVIDVEWAETRVVIRQIDADTVHAVVLDLHQRVIPETLKRTRQSRCEPGDSGYCPALSEAIRRPEQFFQRNLVVVAQHEIVLHVECRRSVFPAEVEGVDLFLDAGGPVHGLAVGVARQYRESSSGALQADLQTVVVRIAHVLVYRVGPNGVWVRRARAVDDRSIRTGINKIFPERPAHGAAWCHILRLTETEA